MSEPVYTPFAVQVLRRVDAVLRGEGCPWPVSEEERALLIVLREHVGRDQSIRRAQLAELTGVSDREVRERISSLRGDFFLAIGTNRTAGGYFLISTAAESMQATGPLFGQAFSILRTARAMAGRHMTAELLGQLRLELKLDVDDTPLSDPAPEAHDALA